MSMERTNGDFRTGSLRGPLVSLARLCDYGIWVTERVYLLLVRLFSSSEGVFLVRILHGKHFECSTGRPTVECGHSDLEIIRDLSSSKGRDGPKPIVRPIGGIGRSLAKFLNKSSRTRAWA